jgi:hypothetical protein
MRFSLLGPIRAQGGDGAVLEIRGTLRRTLLAALLLHADTVVPQDRLADHLWRGEPLADVPALADHPMVRRLEEDRLLVTGGLIEARLNLGRHDEVIGELGTLAAAHPLRETFHGQLMLALYRTGRRAEALDTYLGLRRALVDGLGVEPSAEITDLNRRILDSDEELLHVVAPVATEAALAAPAAPISGSARHELPADTRLFTGRLPEMDELLELSAAASAGTGPGAAVISALDGMAGVGKSALRSTSRIGSPRRSRRASSSSTLREHTAGVGTASPARRPAPAAALAGRPAAADP